MPVLIDMANAVRREFDRLVSERARSGAKASGLVSTRTRLIPLGLLDDPPHRLTPHEDATEREGRQLLPTIKPLGVQALGLQSRPSG
jgi:hypothetical protein